MDFQRFVKSVFAQAPFVFTLNGHFNRGLFSARLIFFLIPRLGTNRSIRLCRGENVGGKRYGSRGICFSFPFCRVPRKAYRHAHSRYHIHRIRRLVGRPRKQFRGIHFGELAVRVEGLETVDEFFEPGGPCLPERAKLFGHFDPCRVDIAGVFRMVGSAALPGERTNDSVAPLSGVKRRVSGVESGTIRSTLCPIRQQPLRGRAGKRVIKIDPAVARPEIFRPGNFPLHVIDIPIVVGNIPDGGRNHDIRDALLLQLGREAACVKPARN
ncbi:MAG: hypothetical protein BWY42_01178 [Candidatus Omnitrophica bacterium ADurb.Bin277]|nr:MAG: hypothetical protein BWY42_01178 [Candidatus Omnitrophica bacterium ADurb.Bin277]